MSTAPAILYRPGGEAYAKVVSAYFPNVPLNRIRGPPLRPGGHRCPRLRRHSTSGARRFGGRDVRVPGGDRVVGARDTYSDPAPAAIRYALTSRRAVSSGDSDATRTRPFVASTERRTSSRSIADIASAHPSMSSGACDEQTGVTHDLGQGGRVRCDHWTPERHRLGDGKPVPLVARRECEGDRRSKETIEMGSRGLPSLCTRSARSSAGLLAPPLPRHLPRQ